jgi:hypothetical protein
MSATFTIYAPGAWWYDIQPAMEDHEREAKEGQRSPAVAEVVSQYWDGETVKRGKGFAHRFDLTSVEAVQFLRDEAIYRFEFQGGNGNPYGNQEPDGKLRRAAWKLVERCDKVLAEVQS